MAGRNYQDLLVWQRAMELVVAVYRFTATLPREETYGLVSQMRRCSVSIPSNIAEGQGRGGDPEMVRFLRIGHGSLRELETQMFICQRLEYGRQEDLPHLFRLAAEVGRMLNGLSRSKSRRSS